MVANIIKIFFILIISLIVTGCYDPMIKASIINKVGKEIKILQYNAPKYYSVVLQDNKSNTVFIHVNFMLKTRNKKYYYDINNAIGLSLNKHSLIKNNIIRLLIDENMQLYVIPYKYKSFISFKKLKKIQPDGFPISPNKIENRRF